MGPDQVTEILRMLLRETVIMSAPILLLATAVSLIVSLGQTLTSLQDQTLSTVPRLAVVGIALLVGMPWLVRRSIYFYVSLLGDLHRYTR
ncbi:MAG TPA: flagellar biosynthetic protein FliQ [Acidobacteriaceae bacterium]|jgi:flagellar biosynthetic protein FliQ|nr:flagellar biosynthetic protein FliQ [Acidobacteriaceae bacterium]